jgi:hypothetical protein
MFICIHILSYYKLFLFLNLCPSIMLDSLSCSFTSIFFLTTNCSFFWICVRKNMDVRGCSGSQKVGARKIARCHFQVPVLKVRSQFRSQLKYLQGANFFVPKLWMIACTTTSFMYKWSGFVCTNVNLLFGIQSSHWHPYSFLLQAVPFFEFVS